MTTAKTTTTDSEHCKSKEHHSKDHELTKKILRSLLNTGYPANEETVEKAVYLTKKLQRTFRLE